MERLCKVSNVSVSGHYVWRSRPVIQRDQTCCVLLACGRECVRSAVRGHCAQSKMGGRYHLFANTGRLALHGWCNRFVFTEICGWAMADTMATALVAQAL